MQYISAKTIISGYKENNNWFGSNYNMNIYKGCNHGCIYCDSRSECYRVEDFDTVRVKQNSLEIIRNDLRSKRKSGVVGTGAMSDPYNPFEKELELTRGALKLIDEFGFGIAIATKSDLISRDIDILQRIQKHSPVLCKITITTCDDKLSKKIEPKVSLPIQRFEAIKKLSEAGIYCGVLLMPVLPFITDTKENILGIVKLAKNSGANFIFPAFGMTLRTNQREYYYSKLEKLFPNLKGKYINQFGENYSCNSPNSKELYYIFKDECDKLGITYKMKDIINGYKSGYQNIQMNLLKNIKNICNFNNFNNFNL